MAWNASFAKGVCSFRESSFEVSLSHLNEVAPLFFSSYFKSDHLLSTRLYDWEVISMPYTTPVLQSTKNFVGQKMRSATPRKS
jgi:hypothetical protein